MAARRFRFALGTVLTSSAIRMGESARNLEQTFLVGMTGDLAAEKLGLAYATDVGRRKAACRRTKHCQVRLGVADRDRLGVRTQHPVAESLQAGTLVDLLGDDGCID